MTEAVPRLEFDQWRAHIQQSQDTLFAEVAAERETRMQWIDTLEARIAGTRAELAQYVASGEQLQHATAASLRNLEEELAGYRILVAQLQATVAELRAEVTAIDASATGVGPQVTADLELAAYFEQVDENYAPLAGTFEAYDDFVTAVADSTRLRPLPLCRFANEGDGAGVALGLRHDIDADPRTAVRMARCLASKGLSGTFFFLHTSVYYRSIIGSAFARRSQLQEWISDIIVAGSEIGLHNDSLGVWQETGTDPLTTLYSELTYLRSCGARVLGTAGHNSAPSYGAENCEVFVGSTLFDRRTLSGLDHVLGSVHPDELGLEYEGTFAVQRDTVDVDAAEGFIEAPGSSTASETWMRTYLSDNPILDWNVDAQLWCQGKDKWVLGGRDMWYWRIGTAEALSLVAAMPSGSRVLAVIHPALYRN